MTPPADIKGKSLKVKNLTLKLPAELPFTMVRWVKGDDVDVENLLVAVLGPEQTNKVWNLGLSMAEGTKLVDDIVGKYDTDTGK